jgi:hypothetical protein
MGMHENDVDGPEAKPVARPRLRSCRGGSVAADRPWFPESPSLREEAVEVFGDKLFDTIQAAPERLREVTGIGPPHGWRGWAEVAWSDVARA